MSTETDRKREFSVSVTQVCSRLIPKKGADYNQEMVDKFDELVAPYGFSWKLRDIMPKALVAGEDAGVLTEEVRNFST